jgi:hypothetical protein
VIDKSGHGENDKPIITTLSLAALHPDAHARQEGLEAAGKIRLSCHVLCTRLSGLMINNRRRNRKHPQHQSQSHKARSDLHLVATVIFHFTPRHRRGAITDLRNGRADLA